MFYTIQMRDRSGLLHYRTDADKSGWTVNANRAIIVYSTAVAMQLGAHYSVEETRSVVVVEHNGESVADIHAATRRPLATFLHGRLVQNA